MEQRSEEAILGNAERLLADATLLSSNGRWPTAHALGLLAIEEIGKVVLIRWGCLLRQSRDTSGRRSFHAKKQAAVGHLFLARAVLRYVAEQGMVDVGNPEDDLRAWRAVWETNEGRYLLAAEIGRLDRIKQLGFYEDPESGLGVKAGDISADDMDTLHRIARDAMSLIDNDGIMQIARGFYEGMKISSNSVSLKKRVISK